MRIASSDRHAWLDEADRSLASAAIAARFPLLERDGFAPSHLLLWDRPGGGWVYVAAIENPQQPGQLCFTATVSAGTVPVTKALMRKYFPGLRDT